LESFSYSVSHDLRAPLRVINGYSNALQEDYSQQLDANANTYLERILVASRRMSGLIDDLLNLSRISRSEMRSPRLTWRSSPWITPITACRSRSRGGICGAS
jgi:light-regulated signal transduction histidine kinase (bacteriophytochrome)